MLSTWLDRR